MYCIEHYFLKQFFTHLYINCIRNVQILNVHRMSVATKNICNTYFVISELLVPDVNECNDAPSCNTSISSCTNTGGSYICRCVEGYAQKSFSVCIGKAFFLRYRMYIAMCLDLFFCNLKKQDSIIGQLLFPIRVRGYTSCWCWWGECYQLLLFGFW